MKPKISGVIIARNEAAVIGRCIASLQAVADEVVVVDSGSTDDTLRISREMGAVIVEQPFLGYGRQKQFAVECAAYDFIVSLDADEWLNPELQQRLNDAKVNGLQDAYTVALRNQYCGKWVRYGGWYKAKVIRLFNRRVGSWNSAVVHESVVLNPGIKTVHLEGEILHEAYENAAEHIAKIKVYAALGAEKLQSKGMAILLLKLVFNPPFKFLSMYFLKLGLLDGFVGLQLSALITYETWLKYRLAIGLKFNT